MEDGSIFEITEMGFKEIRIMIRFVKREDISMNEDNIKVLTKFSVMFL